MNCCSRNCSQGRTCSLRYQRTTYMTNLGMYLRGFWRGLVLYRSLSCAFRVARIWGKQQ